MCVSAVAPPPRNSASLSSSAASSNSVVGAWLATTSHLTNVIPVCSFMQPIPLQHSASASTTTGGMVVAVVASRNIFLNEFCHWTSWCRVYLQRCRYHLTVLACSHPRDPASVWLVALVVSLVHFLITAYPSLTGCVYVLQSGPLQTPATLPVPARTLSG